MPASPPATSPRPTAPIGVFDSGVGGLTVLRALRARLPAEQYVYLGDTARLPYGTKSSASITRYSLQAAQLLIDAGIKCLVVACNTASAVALPALRARFHPIPVLGVVEPGAEAGCRRTRSGRIAVIATESTVAGGAYTRAIAALRPDAEVVSRACPLFVALAEEGLTDGPIATAIARHYLGPLFEAGDRAPDTLVLGCTHFPVLASVVAEVAGNRVALVDSAATTAVALEDVLRARGLAAPAPHTEAEEPMPLVLMATDGPERFARVGRLFLGMDLAPSDVRCVDLGSSGP